MILASYPKFASNVQRWCGRGRAAATGGGGRRVSGRNRSDELKAAGQGPTCAVVVNKLPGNEGLTHILTLPREFLFLAPDNLETLCGAP